MKGLERRIELAKHRDVSKIAGAREADRRREGRKLPDARRDGSRSRHLDHPEALKSRPELKYVSPAQLAMLGSEARLSVQAATPETFPMMRDGDEFREQARQGARQMPARRSSPGPIRRTRSSSPASRCTTSSALLVGAGLTPYQALRAATATAGDWLGDPGIGRIAVGSHADLVVLDADPLEDITATTKRTGVMVRGTWMREA